MRWLLLILVLAGVAGAGYYFYTQEKPLQVTAAPVETGHVEETVAAIASGTVMPGQRAMLAIGAIGTIAEIHVEDGDEVTAGQVLVELEHDDLDAQVALAHANLKDVTSTQLRQARAQLDAARAEYNRVAPLAAREAISKSDFEKAALALRVAEEAVAAAQAAQGETGVRAQDIASAEAIIEQLEAAVAAAEAMREKAFLKAPFDGVVARVMLEKGEAVTMGMPVLSLVSVKDSYIEAPFDEANAGELRVDMPVRIELDAYPDEAFEGRISFISPVIQPNADLARTLNVKVEILGGHSKFLPGMSADVTAVAENRENAIRVPSESLVRDEFAYVIENNRARRRDVKLGIGNWEYQEVLSGLKPGELLVTSVGVQGLADGVLVEVVEELGAS
jgi:HlyD family secretion protein